MADQDKKEAPDFLNMTDEEMRNFDPSTLGQYADEPQENLEDAVDPAVVVDDTAAAIVADAEIKEDLVEDDEDKAAAILAADDSVKEDKSAVVEDKAAVVEAGKEKPAAVGEKEAISSADPASEIDYKALYEKITAPFKANGRDIQIKSPEDAVALMQMGANYNKKMAGLKPNLKLMKMLESNGLLDEAKISYLIDLDKKDPEAINRLVKDSGIDPLDLSDEKASGYKPKSYAVDERELELDAVLGELESSPHYARTLEVVSNKWDGASKSIVASNPEILTVINAHMGNGIYDMITSELENERTFGRLKGLSDLEAYRQVGDSIQARGGFAHLGFQKQEEAPPEKVVQPKPAVNQVNEEAIRDKKRAASSTKTAVSTPASQEEFNPLSLSDEEFAKLAKPKFN